MNDLAIHLLSLMNLKNHSEKNKPAAEFTKTKSQHTVDDNGSGHRDGW